MHNNKITVIFYFHVSKFKKEHNISAKHDGKSHLHSPQNFPMKTLSKVPSDMAMLEVVGERKLLLLSVLELVIKNFLKIRMK
jgi:hypothetical protein